MFEYQFKYRLGEKNMNFRMNKIESQEQIKEFARIAEIVWNEHFTSIIGKAQVDYMLDKFQSEHAVTDQIQNQGYEYYFIEVDDNKVGYIGIRKEEEALFLSKLYILKEHRKKGYSSMALEFLVNLCKDSGLKSIYLTVNKYNYDTIQVYKAKGFQIFKEQVSDIGNGFVMDDYVMELQI